MAALANYAALYSTVSSYKIAALIIARTLHENVLLASLVLIQGVRHVTAGLVNSAVDNSLMETCDEKDYVWTNHSIPIPD